MKLGPAIVSDGNFPDWPTSRALVRRMAADCARVRTPAGFGFDPARVNDLIADGVTTIILCTEDNNATPEETQAEIEGRGFLALIDQHPQVIWVLELGNEPGGDLWAHRYYALESMKRLKPRWQRPNLLWSVSMPTRLNDAMVLFARDQHGSLLDYADAYCCHVYGWSDMHDGGGGDWLKILDYGRSLSNLGKRLPIYLTECGVDDRSLSTAEKARRMLDWLDGQPDLAGVCVWGLGAWAPNPTYEIDGAMADVFGARVHTAPFEGATPVQPVPQPQGNPTVPPIVIDQRPIYPAGNRTAHFPETGLDLSGPFLTYWESHGGLAQFGYPVRALEWDGHHWIQWCERCRLEWHPENATPYDVLLGLLGRELLDAKGIEHK